MTTKIQHTQHPISLWYLSAIFATLTFAYIGISTIIVLFAIQKLHYSSHNAYLLYAAFSSLLFTLSLPGGYLSSLFGHKYAAAVGMLFSIVGSALLAIAHSMFFYIGLAAFVIGYGLATPAIWCLVGHAYAKEDIRRESGYTLFYLLFNIGAFTAAIVEGYVSTRFNYADAYLLIAVLIFIGLFIYYITLPRLTVYPGRSVEPQLSWSPMQITMSLCIICLIAVAPVGILLYFPQVCSYVLAAAMIIAIVMILQLAFKQKTNYAKWRVILFLILTLLSLIFWALYMLEPSLMTVFAKYNVNRKIAGFDIPASSFYSLDPLGVILIGILFSWLWRYLAKRNRDISLPAKFCISLMAMGIGYWIFMFGIRFAGYTHLVNPLWLVLGFVFLSSAELLISPIGISMSGRLAPEGKEGPFVGIWTLNMGFSAILSAFISNLTTKTSSIRPEFTNPIYAKVFFEIGIVAIIAGVIMSFFISKMQRLLGKEKKTHAAK